MSRFILAMLLVASTAQALPAPTKADLDQVTAWQKAGFFKLDDPETNSFEIGLKLATMPEEKQSKAMAKICQFYAASLEAEGYEVPEDCYFEIDHVTAARIGVGAEGVTTQLETWYRLELRRRAFARAK